MKRSHFGRYIQRSYDIFDRYSRNIVSRDSYNQGNYLSLIFIWSDQSQRSRVSTSKNSKLSRTDTAASVMLM